MTTLAHHDAIHFITELSTLGAAAFGACAAIVTMRIRSRLDLHQLARTKLVDRSPNHSGV